MRIVVPGRPLSWVWAKAMPEHLLDGRIIFHGLLVVLSEYYPFEKCRAETAKRRRRTAIYEYCPGQVSMTVWDTCIGIHPQDFERLFKPFVQLDASLSQQYEGAGLALVQQIAVLLGGDVLVQSSAGQGSRFTVHLLWQP